ncbi:(S)-norcoclaurine synthase [Bertholletia excelsa]
MVEEKRRLVFRDIYWLLQSAAGGRQQSWVELDCQMTVDFLSIVHLKQSHILVNNGVIKTTERKNGGRKVKPLGIWGFPPVDNVQTLASKKLEDIPLHYVRPESELGQVSANESLHIPVNDMSKLCDNKELAKLHQVRKVCKDWGIFQLINHGISEAIARMKEVTEEFLQQPLKKKMTCAQLPSSIKGHGQAFVVSKGQKFDRGDMPFLLQPVQRRNMRVWPTNPQFRDQTYSLELQGLAISLLRLMARSLGLDLDAFTTLYEDGVQGITMNYYPPCQEASKVMGLTTHSDATELTLRIQDGKWVPIKPLPDAVIINNGDFMEITGNGEYSSIEHRPMVNLDKERLSIAGFHSPNMSAVVGHFTDLVKEGGAKYKTLDHKEYMKMVVSSKLDGKSLLDYTRIKQ